MPKENFVRIVTLSQADSHFALSIEILREERSRKSGKHEISMRLPAIVFRRLYADRVSSAHF
jgi:hypothetical protein